MMAFGKIGKKLLLMGITLSMTMVMTGCTEIPSNIQSDIANAFRERATANTQIADDLYNNGIISEKTHKLLVDGITKNLEDFGANIKNADGAGAKNLLKACVDWRFVPELESNLCYTDEGVDHDHSIDYTNGDSNSTYLTTALVNAKASIATDNVPVLGGNGHKIKPIEVISESLMDQLNEELSIPIYVLKTDITEAEGLDGIIEAVRAAKEKDNEAGIVNYFQAVTYTDSNGKETAATLLDKNNPEAQLVRVTTGSRYATDTFTATDVDTFTVERCGYDGEKCAKDHTGSCTATHNKLAYSHNQGGLSGIPYGYSGNEPGKDMIFASGGEEQAAFRLIEFNKKAVDELFKRIGLGDQRYLVINGHAYLMEYPVGYVAGFKESEDQTSYMSIIERSELNFNLLTGDFSKTEYNESTGEFSSTSKLTNKEDPYLTFDGALTNTDTTRASLVLYGNTGVDDATAAAPTDPYEILKAECNPNWNWSLGEYTASDGKSKEEVIINSGRIVLRDYLEATYAPDVVDSDKLVVLGRKLRIAQFEGSKDNVLAEFYDKSGNKLPDNGAVLFINDVCDFDSLITDAEVNYISKFKEAHTDTDTSTGSSGDSDADDDEESTDNVLKESLSKVSELPHNVTDKVITSTQFPGKHIGSSDVNYSDEKPLFYAMAVHKSMFETGLFSGWVQSTDTEKNSTIWWNTWLESHGYNYSINTDNLVKFLKGNYAYDLNKSGIITLDLETIAKIQQEYTEEHQQGVATGMRTLFMVFGYILIAYAIILMIAWNVDVNVDLGFGILEKASFGRWVAVKSYEEMPYMNMEDTKFINFGGLLASCVGIIVTGILLITVNIVDLVLMLIQLFGGVAEYITRILTGVR